MADLVSTTLTAVWVLAAVRSLRNDSPAADTAADEVPVDGFRHSSN